MDNVDVPTPNPFITDWLKGPICRSIMFEAGEILQALYREVGGQHARTGREIAETRIETFIEEGRWKSNFIVMVPYAASEIFGTGNHPNSTHRRHQKASRDLNTALSLMSKL